MSFSISKILAVLVSLIGLLGFFCIHDGHNWSDDFALYLSQCLALQDGSMMTLFEQNRYAMDHSFQDTGPYLYPNGFPLLLVPIYSLVGLNFVILKSYCWLFFLLALPLIYLIFRQKRVPSKFALLITLLVGFNYHFIRFSDNILSDLPFFFFSLLTFYFIQKSLYKTLGQALLIGLLLFVSYSIRDVGILLFPVLLVQQFLAYRAEKTWNIAYFLPYILFLLLLFLVKYYTPSGPSKHLSMLFETSFEVLLNNLKLYWLLIGNYFLIFREIPPYIQGLVATLFVGFILVGMLSNRFEKPSFLVYIGVTMGLYFVWVAFLGMRYIFPILPFLIYYLVMGIQAVFKKEKVQHIIFAGLVCSSLAQSLFISYYSSQHDSNEAYSNDLQQIYTYIKEELPKDAVIVFHKPRALRLFSERNAISRNLPEASYALVRNYSENDEVLFKTASYSLIKK